MRSRKTSETHSIPEVCLVGTLGTTRDSEGSPARLTYPDGRVLNYTYSARSQLKTVTGHWIAEKTCFSKGTGGF